METIKSILYLLMKHDEYKMSFTQVQKFWFVFIIIISTDVWNGNYDPILNNNTKT